ncbi:MAG: TldD/PmbA family protein [Nitrososphaeria archaeon]
MLLDLCFRAVKRALKLGVNDAEAFASESVETEAVIENNDVKVGRSHRRAGIGVRVLKASRMGFSSTNDLTRGGLFRAVDEAISISNFSPPSPYNMLPEGVTPAGLQGLYQPEVLEFTLREVASKASEMLDSARGYSPKVTVDTGYFAATVDHHAVVNSNGVRCEEKSGMFLWYILGMAREGQEVSSFDYQLGSSRTVRGIDVESTAIEFAQNVTCSLGGKRCGSFRGSVVLAPYAVEQLLSRPLAWAISSNNVQKGRSRFQGRLNQRVSSEALTLTDDASFVEGAAAGSFDREGVPRRPLTVIEKGVLRAYLYNSYTALKNSRMSTGHASGEWRSTPSVNPTNILVDEGSVPKDELISGVRRGVLVTRFSGFPNPVTGDFSGVVKGGYMIEGGKVVRPLKETLITGNVFDLLLRLSSISKERKTIISHVLPYMGFEDVSITSG